MKLPIQAGAAPRRLFKLPLIATFVVALVAFTLFRGYSGSPDIAQAFDAVSPTASHVQTPSETDTRIQTYTDTINSLVAANRDENITVSTIDLSNDSRLTLGDPGTYTAASTAKMITAITLLHEVEQGRATLNKSLEGQKARQLLQNMVVNSDNAAWQTLNSYLTHDTLKTYMSQLGLVEYDPDVNTVQPSDIGELLDKTHTGLLLSYMKQANKTEYIADNVPAGFSVYHKAGWLEGLMHDVAIISNGQKTIVLAIYTFNPTAPGDSAANQELYKSITQAALKAYFPG
jgi:beta-lactamase class A